MMTLSNLTNVINNDLIHSEEISFTKQNAFGYIIFSEKSTSSVKFAVILEKKMRSKVIGKRYTIFGFNDGAQAVFCKESPSCKTPQNLIMWLKREASVRKCEKYLLLYSNL